MLLYTHCTWQIDLLMYIYEQMLKRRAVVGYREHTAAERTISWMAGEHILFLNYIHWVLFLYLEEAMSGYFVVYIRDGQAYAVTFFFLFASSP